MVNYLDVKMLRCLIPIFYCYLFQVFGVFWYGESGVF